MTSPYILQTNNLAAPRLWVIRAAQFLIGLLTLDLVKLLITNSAMLWIVYVALVIFLVAFILQPTDELTLDSEKLCYIKKSILPFLSRTTQYEVKNIESIAIDGKLTSKSLFYQVMPFAYSLRGQNKIQLTLKDSSVVTHETSVYKEDLEQLSAQLQDMLG